MNTNLFSFISENFGIICLILFLILSEVLAFKPTLGSSGIVQLVYNLLKTEAKKAQPQAVKIMDCELKDSEKTNSSKS